MTEHDSSDRRNKLIEFESGAATGLAPFEGACTLLLDVYGMDVATGLEEFEHSLEMVLLDERPDEESAESDEHEAPAEVPEEETGEAEYETKEETGPGGEFKEEEPPYEKEPVEPVEEPPREPANPVIGFVCGHSLNIEDVADESGRMYAHPMVHLIELPCAGMVKPEWLTRIIGGKASGVFVVSCGKGSCYHRTGAEIIADRLNGARRPMPVGKFDRRRLRLFVSHTQSRAELQEAIGKFASELGKLDEEEQTYLPEPEEERVIEVEEQGPYTGLM